MGLPSEGYLPVPASTALRASCGRLSRSARFASLDRFSPLGRQTHPPGEPEIGAVTEHPPSRLGTALALGERGGKWQMENGKWQMANGRSWAASGGVEAPLGEPEVGAVMEHPPSRLGTALALGERGGKWQMENGKWQMEDRGRRAVEGGGSARGTRSWGGDGAPALQVGDGAGAR